MGGSRSSGLERTGRSPLASCLGNGIGRRVSVPAESSLLMASTVSE